MTSPAIPESIGSYRITSKLGQGGMGAVYLAMHETLERPAAVKLLPHELATNPEYVTRFLREARVVATLRHDNIVQVYDAGKTKEDKYFIAMELVDGMSLGKYLDEQGALSEAEALDLLTQSARGLAAAHAAGLVHRDIKPDNMLLDKKKTLRIVDFGLVMESSSTTQLTASGACLGTPMYMSPEQADGDKADACTDIYSLGITFYRAVAGQPPFNSPTVMNLLFKHKFESPADPRALKPEISENMAYLLLRMMSKRREDRPQNGQQVLDLIEGMKQGKPVPPPAAFQSPLTGSTTSAGTAVTMVGPRGGTGVVPAAPPKPGMSSGTKLVLVGAVAAFLLLGLGGAIGAFLYFKKPAPTVATNTPGISPNTGGTSTNQVPIPIPVTPTNDTRQPVNSTTNPPVNISQNPLPPLPTPNEEAFDRAMTRARAAEALGDYTTAAMAYAEANGIKYDPNAARKKEEMLARAKGETDFLAYIQAGDNALKINDFDTARTNYLKALNVKPSSPIPGPKMTEVDARESFKRGTDAQARGDMATAQAHYQKALQLNPALKPEIEQRLALSNPVSHTPPPPVNTGMPATVVAGIEQLVRDGNTQAALRRADDSLAQYPGQPELTKIKAALAALAVVEKVSRGMSTITTNALSTAAEARGLDSGDSTARNLRDYLEEKRRDISDKERSARAQFMDRKYEDISRTLDTTKGIARDTGSELDNAQASYLRKAEDAENFVGVKLPGFSIGKKGGDKKKAEAYRRIAKDFDGQSEEAKALGR